MTKRNSRKGLTAEIVATVEAILDEGSRRVGGETASRYHCDRAAFGSLRIKRSQPGICVSGVVCRPAVVDIWNMEGEKVTKVFSAETNPPLLIGIHKGGWIEELISHAHRILGASSP